MPSRQCPDCGYEAKTKYYLERHDGEIQAKGTRATISVAGKSDYGNLLILQNAIQNGYLPLIAAQVADITGSSIHTKMILSLAAIVSILASPTTQGTSSISDHLKVISFFVVIFQWDVRSSLWWFYVTLLYLVFFVFEVVVPTKILKNPKVYLPLHSTFIVTANMCLTDLIKTQQN